MLTEEQITDTAREYAEEINPAISLKTIPYGRTIPKRKMIADLMRNALSEVTAEQTKDFEGFLRFLLQRYCLVEKVRITLEAIEE